jgi:predicted dehydrogenase
MGPGVAVQEDKMSILLAFADGSIGTINYFSNGAKSYPKEQLEIFSEGRILKLDNFRKTTGYGFRGFSSFRTRRIDKGHFSEFREFLNRVESGGEQLIPLSQLVNATLATFAAVTSAQENRNISLAAEYGIIVADG